MTLKQDLQSVITISNTLKPIFESTADVHTYTPVIGRECLKVLNIDKAHAISSLNQNFNAVANDILRYSANNPKVATVLNTIRANLNRVEGETGLNVTELLIRTWNLADKTSFRNAKDAVIGNLVANIEYKGGCFAGIAGRLGLPYITFVQNIMENKLQNAYQPVAYHAPEMDDLAKAIEASMQITDYDRDLEEALFLSTQSYTPARAAVPVFEVEPEDAELAEVLALSRFMY